MNNKEVNLTNDACSLHRILKTDIKKVPNIYEDEIFFRYICAKVKISVGSKLSVFKFSLPGGVEIDYDGIRDMGTEEMDKILEEIKGDEGVDWMMHS